jgi:hypothetical protein
MKFLLSVLSASTLLLPFASSASAYSQDPRSCLDPRTQYPSNPHLKAYATTKPLVQTLVDPRFGLVKRGSAPLLGQLAGKWAEDINYDKKIMTILRHLYELSGFF